ncbi:HD-GYP domain-containing protein [Desulfotomaculum varum]
MFLTVKRLFIKLPKNIALHSKRVAMLSYILAKHMKLSATDCQNIYWGGLLHDIGKSVIHPRILYKKAKLTEAEFAEIKRHCQYGVDIVKNIKDIEPVIPIIQYHHEHWNGSGYYGLQNYQIPLGARLVSIADAFDAMTSYRSYQATRKKEDALAEIMRCSNTQFDPYLVNHFIEIYTLFNSYLDDHVKFVNFI